MSTALDKVQTQAPSLAQVVQQMVPEIRRALPKGMDPDRIARLALTAIRKSDIEARKSGKPGNSLANCTPASFAGALLTAAALGLEPDINGEAYLVPYKGECTLIIGYQGMAKLFWNSPLAKHLDAQAVYENDQFDYQLGLEPSLTHRPATGDRGQVVSYYAVATLMTGASQFIVLSPEQVKALRGGKVGPSGRIDDPMHWMERKTVLRQLFKTLPRSTELNRALDVDERGGKELHAELVQEHETVDKTTGELSGPRQEIDAPAEDHENAQWDSPADSLPIDGEAQG